MQEQETRDQDVSSPSASVDTVGPSGRGDPEALLERHEVEAGSEELQDSPGGFPHVAEDGDNLLEEVGIPGNALPPEAGFPLELLEGASVSGESGVFTMTSAESRSESVFLSPQ